MNSSGMKRGLAATAISALAVTGLPFLATSAGAAPGDNFTVAFTGPALNGDSQGAVVVIRAEVNEIDETLLEVTSTTSPDAGSEDTGEQTVDIVGTPTASPDPANSAYELIEVRIQTTTTTTGATASFRLFENDGTDPDALEASEARQPVSITTAGPLAQIDVSPASQTSAAGVESAPYTVTIKDSAGRTTQLAAAETITIADEGEVANEDDADVITAAELARGTHTFTATGPDVDVYNMTLTSNTDPVVSANAILDVVKTAAITKDEVNVVTGADSWSRFGDHDGGTTAVRVDQGSIRIDIRSTDVPADRNGTVTLTVQGNGVTFGGKDKTTASTVLDANGMGSLTITPDAGTIQEGDSFAVSGAFAQTFVFQRSAVTAIAPDADRYVSAIDGSVTVSATVVDQFGLPVSSGEVSARRISGPNAETTAQRKAVDSNGQVSFTFTDVNAVPGQEDTVEFLYFVDQFDKDGEKSATTKIRYTTDGQGSDFTTRLDNVTASGSGYDPASIRVIPLADAEADDDGGTNESADLDVVNATPGTPISVSVDNGALILEPDEDFLAEGSASIDDVVTDPAGTLPDGYRIIGTQAGLTTVTITSSGRTETAQFTVTGQSDKSTARNVSVSGPATADAGELVTFTAVVTDAFGNGIAGIPANALNVQVTGPGELQDSGAVTDATGSIALNVRLQDDAQGSSVSINVTGIPANGNQFGAAADRLEADSTTNDGPGLPASSNAATATVAVNAEEPPAEPVSIVAKLKGKNNAGKADKLKVVAPKKAAGATVKLMKFKKNGKKVVVAQGVLNAKGDKGFKVADKNGKKLTQYIAKVMKTDDTKGTKTNRRKVR
jgi:hypothetical protein